MSLFSSCKRTQYEAKYDLVTALAHRWGFRTYNKNLSWFSDKEFKDIWKKYPESGDYIHERKFTLWSIARSIRNIPGDIAECGVFKAGSSFLMLSANNETGKHLFGFDSFEGLSDPGEKDKVMNNRAFEWKARDMAVGEEIAATNLAAFHGNFTLLKGWIPDRFTEVYSKRFSLVHIDVDLYDPTLASLEFFYPRMNPGGMIVCDDYGFDTCPGARTAMDNFAKTVNKSVIHLTTGQGILMASG